MPSRYRLTWLQSLYSVPCRVFWVNPALADPAEAPNLTLHLANHVLPPALEPPPILLATDDRGRNPVENHFRFDMLLGEVRQSRTSLALLADLKKRHQPDEDQGLYETLNDTVKLWHKTIVQDLNGNPNHFDLERFLLYGEQIPNTQ